MDTRGGNTRHTTEDWHNSPLPKGVSHAVTVPPRRGGGGGALDAPQDRHEPEHRTGTSRAEQTDRRPWRCRELRRPWQMVFGGLGLGPLGPAPPAGTLLPPPNFPGVVRGYQEPSGAKQTGQDRNRTGTGQSTETGSPPGLSSEAEASSGHDMTSGALTGSLSNRFHDKGAGG